MTDALSQQALARQVVVRYRSPGHVRFAVPAALCDESFAGAIEASLRRQTGVYRVTLYRHQRKLSVFYDEHACELHDVARCLHGALAAPAARRQREQKVEAVAQRLHVARPLQWLKSKVANRKPGSKEKAAQPAWLQRLAAKALRNPALQDMFTEKAMINFLNDVAVFYLIKVHWDMITQKWLKQPLKYGNAWLTTFYLVFLLMRSRRKPPGKS